MARLRAFIERWLPWYDRDHERERDSTSQRIARRSEVARERAERVIAEYQNADEAASRAGDRLIEEARK